MDTAHGIMVIIIRDIVNVMMAGEEKIALNHPLMHVVVMVHGINMMDIVIVIAVGLVMIVLKQKLIVAVDMVHGIVMTDIANAMLNGKEMIVRKYQHVNMPSVLSMIVPVIQAGQAKIVMFPNLNIAKMVSGIFIDVLVSVVLDIAENTAIRL